MSDVLEQIEAGLKLAKQTGFDRAAWCTSCRRVSVHRKSAWKEDRDTFRLLHDGDTEICHQLQGHGSIDECLAALKDFALASPPKAKG